MITKVCFAIARRCAVDIQLMHARCSETVDGLTTRGPSRATLRVIAAMRSRCSGQQHNGWPRPQFLASKHAARGMGTQKLPVAGYITRGPSRSTFHVIVAMRRRAHPPNFGGQVVTT